MDGVVAALLLLLSGARAQFGNAHVQWDANANPTVTTPGHVPTREFTPPADTRHSGLRRLSTPKMERA